MHNKNIPHLSNVINGEFLFMAIIYYVAKGHFSFSLNISNDITEYK